MNEAKNEAENRFLMKASKLSGGVDFDRGVCVREFDGCLCRSGLAHR